LFNFIYRAKGEEEYFGGASHQFVVNLSPMNTKEQINTIDAIQYFFKKDKRVVRAWLLGAFARNEQRPIHQIELVVELQLPLLKNAFYELLDITLRLEELLECKVEIVEKSSEEGFHLANFHKESVKIFG
jgi:predicted nucleotidyltransferase